MQAESSYYPVEGTIQSDRSFWQVLRQNSRLQTHPLAAASRARLANSQPEAAIGMLDGLRKKQPGFRPEQVSLALAKAYAAAGMHDQAGAEFAAAVERFAGIEARVEYAIWAMKRNERAVVEPQLKELNHSRKHMNKYTRSLHQELCKRLDAAVKLAESL
jgi:hypothetical protein